MRRYAKPLSILGVIVVALGTAGWLLASQPQLLKTGGDVRVVGCDGDTSEQCLKLFCERALFLDARLGGPERIGHVEFTHYNDKTPGIVSYMGAAHPVGVPVGAAPIEVACTLRGTEVVATQVALPPGYP
ncbi:MAG: hypothetical protein O9284_18775 [Steroidobacteraceae bacterium]|nr:hypothetical protein [Steroidobacteraceae bacterium]